MEIFHLFAPPIYWSDEIKLFDHCSGKMSVKLDFDTEAMGPSTFSIRIHLPTSFTPIEFIGPANKVIELPEECFYLKVSLKSHFTGQQIICKVS